MKIIEYFHIDEKINWLDVMIGIGIGMWLTIILVELL